MLRACVQAFMLNQGTYVDMLDEMCYYLMFLTAATTCISMLVEIATPDSLWAGCTRVYSTWMQVRRACTSRFHRIGPHSGVP